MDPSCRRLHLQLRNDIDILMSCLGLSSSLDASTGSYDLANPCAAGDTVNNSITPPGASNDAISAWINAAKRGDSDAIQCLRAVRAQYSSSESQSYLVSHLRLIHIHCLFAADLDTSPSSQGSGLRHFSRAHPLSPRYTQSRSRSHGCPLMAHQRHSTYLPRMVAHLFDIIRGSPLVLHLWHHRYQPPIPLKQACWGHVTRVSMHYL